MEMGIFILYHNFYTTYITIVLEKEKKRKEKVKLYSFINKK